VIPDHHALGKSAPIFSLRFFRLLFLANGPLPMRVASARSLLTAALLLLVGMSSAGCLEGSNYRAVAAGPSGEVTVVVDSARWNGAVGNALRQTLGQSIETLPIPEPAFDLRQMDLTTQNLERVKRHKNILVAGALGTSSQEAEFLRQQFSEQARQAVERSGGTVVAQPDLWRRQQQVFYVAAPTPDQLAATIRQQGAALRDSLNVATRRRMTSDMFEEGRQFALEDSLLSRHGFAVKVQHDYQIATDTLFTGEAQGGFVLLVRKLPDTWRRLFVWYRDRADPATISRDWVLSMRDSLAGEYLQGAQQGAAYTDRRRTLNVEEVDYLGRYAYETRGTWYMAVDTADAQSDDGRLPLGGGGPFVNYTFYDQEQERLYMVDGAVFAPDYDKREFLRQMKVIAYTFRTRPEVRRQRQNQQTAAR
jgi:hypothetical protein